MAISVLLHVVMIAPAILLGGILLLADDSYRVILILPWLHWSLVLAAIALVHLVVQQILWRTAA